MLHRLVVAVLVLVSSVATADAGIEVHATCAAELSQQPTHVRILREEVARALGSAPVTARYTVDVSLVQLQAVAIGSQLEVRAEVRALLSDGQGRMRWQTTSRAVVRGVARDRASLHRDAVRAAAREVATSVRARTKG